MPEPSLDDRRDGVAARLAELTTRFSQSEVARKTGASRNNVNRYLHGTRIPCEFAGALVEKLGINPSWFLCGEGTPYLTDVNAGTSSAAGNLLELVRAMSSVARMRLGALGGKHHLRVLRELNDALRDFESLRERLNENTAPIMGDMLDRYSDVIRKGEISQADDLRAALVQLSRLCHDERLNERFLLLQARHELFYGNADAGLEMQRRIFRSVYGRSPGLTEELASAAGSLCMHLYFGGHAREAASIARSVLALGDGNEDFDDYHRLNCLLSSAEMWLGRLDSALPRFMSHYHRMSPDARQAVVGSYVLVLLLSGSMPYEAMLHALRRREETQPTALLVYAIWLEDAEVIQHVCDVFPGFTQGPGLQRFIGRYAACLLDVLNGRKGAWRQVHSKDVRAQFKHDAGDPTALMSVVALAQLPRLAGDRKLARKELKRAIARIKAIPAHITPGILNLACHHANVLKLVPKREPDQQLAGARDEAVAFFKRMVAQGFGAFREFEQHYRKG